MNVKDAGLASRFWSEALGYAYRDGGYSADVTPVLVPGGAPSREAPPAIALALDEADRMHLDLYTDSSAEQREEVERLLALGAIRVDWSYPADANFVVLADPDGNLFCVVDTGPRLPPAEPPA